MSKNNKRKIKILCYADSPACATGFGSVIRGIFYNLVQTGRYDVDIFGINDRGGWKDPQIHPYRIYPAMHPGSQDFYGRARFVDVMRGVDIDIKPPWDIVFTLQDPFILEQKLFGYNQGLMLILKELSQVYRTRTKPKNWFKTVSYFPIDSPIKGNWITDAIGLADRTVAYTKYGKEEIEKANNSLDKPLNFKTDIIYHGVDIEAFKPISKKESLQFRKDFFQNKVSEDTFLVATVARNQMRKDIPRTMKVFREFIKRRPDSYLYIHAKDHDAWGSLAEYARNFTLVRGENWACPGKFSENVGYPVEYLNKIYNIADVHLSTTLGEGWGMPITEAMAAKTLNIYPNITSIPEIFGVDNGNDNINMDHLADKELRGLPIKSYSTTSEWATYGPNDYERLRPLTNVDDAVEKLIWAYDHPDSVEEIRERAYNWVSQLSWKRIAKQWDVLFQGVYQELELERRRGNSAVKTNKHKKNKPKQTKSK